MPWLHRIVLRQALANYAAIEGSRKLEKFRSRRRIYLMTCAVKTRACQMSRSGVSDSRAMVEMLVL